jgi:transposase-like protein
MQAFYYIMEVTTMRAARIPEDEQLRLINECRKSGLTDCQWCQLHDIKPGTFYNWVKRLRQKGCIDAHESHETVYATPVQQEVVQISLHPSSPVMTHVVAEETSDFLPCMELCIGGTTLKLTNHTDPTLLATTLKLLRGISC